MPRGTGFGGNELMGVLLVGCGRMGGALARGWRSNEDVAIFDPAAPAIEGVRRLGGLDEADTLAPPLTVVIAVKPQILGEVLPSLRPLAQAGALIVSVVAGATLATLRNGLGEDALLVRTMPNTPAAVGRGITAGVAGDGVSPEYRERAAQLLEAGGDFLWLEDEDQMDAVTAVSGSGPAYFFRFTEALARAGVGAGLSEDVAMRLARATFVGAGALAGARQDDVAALRQEVTSPGGTTAAALARLDAGEALDRLVAEAVEAAAARSRELAS